jgi:hypothetical protein
VTDGVCRGRVVIGREEDEDDSEREGFYTRQQRSNERQQCRYSAEKANAATRILNGPSG